MIKLRPLLITLLLLLSTTVATYAQTGSIKAMIIDRDAPDVPIAGAVVEVSPKDNPEMKLYFATDGNGELLVPTIKIGEYFLNVTFLGYTPKQLEVKLEGGELELPDIMLESSSLAIDAVVKEVKALRASQKGDTLNYNAASFKVSNDADVEGLLTKMPGISIDGGEVTAQGETVKRIYVDGREFFGNDVATALKSLPAEVVERIEVYDNLSDDAKFSGIDDGNGEKSINIVTKPSMRKGVFGKVYAGYGYEPDAYAADFGRGGEVDSGDQKYMAGGNINIFRNSSRITLLGLYNNINQQSFSFEDIAGVSDEDNTSSDFQMKQQPGISKVQAFGVNFSDQKGADERGKNAKLKVQGSYFYNNTYTINDEHIDRWYEAGSGSTIDSLRQSTYQITDNTNHRFNGKIDWRINDRHSLMVRPTASIQMNEQYRGIEGERFKLNKDGLEEPDYDGSDTYQTYGNWRMPENFGYNVGASANYRYKVGEKGSTLTMGANFSVNNWESETNRENYDANNYTFNEYLEDSSEVEEASTLAYQQYEDYYSKRLNLGGNIGYNAQITKNITLSNTYKYSRNQQESDKTTYRYDPDSYYTDDDGNEVYIYDNDPNLYNYYSSIIDEDLLYPESTNNATSIYTTHKIGPSFRYYKNKSNIVASLYYQRSEIYNTTVEYDNPDEVLEIDKGYNNLTYSLISQIYINPEHSLRFNFNSYTSNPSIYRLQDIYNISGDYISKGNPTLDPSYTNRMTIRYTFSDLEKGRTFIAVLWASQTNNYLTSHVYLDPQSYDNDGNLAGAGNVYINGELNDEVVQYTTYAALDNHWSFYGRLNYGIPLDFMKCNLNLNAILNYSLVPSIFGGEYIQSDGTIYGGSENMTSNMSYRVYTVLGSNISDKVDFTLTWRGSYSEATNTSIVSESGTVKNKYWDHQATASMKFIFGERFTFGAKYSYQHYKGITNDYDEQMSILNAYVGYRLFKNKRGEVNVGVNDIFNQNMSFTRYVGNNYSQNKTDLVIGRYYTAQFIYNLRMFGKGASKNMKDYDFSNEGDDDHYSGTSSSSSSSSSKKKKKK
ncbi:MAG: outer membrane beta-barrel protein [Rikenellaceae bacterium]